MPSSFAIASPFICEKLSEIPERLLALIDGGEATTIGLKDEVEELHHSTLKIRYILKQAELGVLTNNSISSWLSELQNVVYDVETIIDDITTDYPSLVCPKTSVPPTFSCSCFSQQLTCYCTTKSNHKMGRMLTEASRKLDKIAPELERRIISPTLAIQTRLDRVEGKMTRHGSVGTVRGVIEKGIGEAVGWLTDEKHENCEDGMLVGAMAIVGTAGIGKSTLLSRVLHHPVIENGRFFRNRVFVSMYSKSHENILQEILRKIKGETFHSQELYRDLKEAMTTKAVLLVLDDVHDNDAWEDLSQVLLEIDESSSRVLIATREEATCRRIPTSNVIRLHAMHESDALLLLCMNAFGGDGKLEDLHDHMMDVGKNIVEKCQYVPLAIEAIGSVLASMPKERAEWEGILNHKIWSLDLLGVLGIDENLVKKEVMNAIFINYLDLPLQHKQCFAYCSMFPEDHDFHKLEMVDYWISEGLVQTGDMGEEIFEDLSERKFLKENCDDGLGKRIHRLVHLLGRHLFREEIFFGSTRTVTKTISSIRRASFVNEDSLADYVPVRNQERLIRSMMFFRSPGLREIPASLFKKLQNLRVLRLRGMGIQILPDSVGHLVHLRHLDLSCTPIKSLPERLGELRCLMFLLLIDCKSLHVLPDGITKLQSLRVMNLTGTNIHRKSQMLRELRQLQVLEWSVKDTAQESTHSWSIMEEVMHLENLTQLSLKNLENLNNGVIAREAGIQDKLHLKHLCLYWDVPNSIDEEVFASIEHVFEELRPPPSLKKLDIYRYYGRNLPFWFASPSVGELAELTLEDCRLCMKLPGLGYMTQLKELTIRNATSINEIPIPRQHLELMSLRGIPKLKEFCSIFNLRTLKISDLENLEAIPDLPNLRKLQTMNCPAISRVGMMESLEEIHWGDETNQVLSPWLGLVKSTHVAPRAPNLKDLYISTISCKLLRRLCPWEIGVDWEIIQNVPHVSAYWRGSPFFVEFRAGPVSFKGRLPKGRFDRSGICDERSGSSSTSAMQICGAASSSA